MKAKIKTYLLWFAPISLWFAVMFTALRIYEQLFASDPGSKLKLVSLGYLYDWPFAFRLVFVCLIITLPLSFVSERIGKTISFVIYGILLLLGFCLTHYFTVTNVLLSADVFGYSTDDVATTLSSSEGVTIATIVSLILFLGVFVFGTVFLLRQHLGWRFCITIMLNMIVIALLPIAPSYDRFESESDYNLVENKSRYFYQHAFEYLQEESALLSDNNFKTEKKYPFLKTFRSDDVLGKFFHANDSLPNLVFLFVEGLGKDFVGDDAAWGGFTPFLDSLAQKSLYWPNALSNAGRTFGVLPTVLGSLPYGKNGFMNYGANMPDHQSLLSVLKSNGYETHYFYGGNPDFDQQDLFMQYQGVDYTLNESNFPPSYAKQPGNAAYAWGFPDRKVFQASLEILNERKHLPRTDVYLTLSTHEPFVSPEPRFNALADERIAAESDESRKRMLNEYRDVFSCLLYTDDAIRELLNRYKSRKEYNNTIFIITGDHRLVPVPQRTKLSRFQVPLIIWSPMLNTAKTFRSVVFHSDIFPSFLSFLSSTYGIKTPAKIPLLSSGLKTDTTFSSETEMGLMRSKGSVQDFVDRNFFFSEGHLFTIQPDMDLEPVSDKEKSSLIRNKLRKFSRNSRAACDDNRLDSLNRPNPLKQFSFTKEEETILQEENIDDLNPEEMFRVARDYALKRDFERSRIILRNLLNAKPNFHDAKILLSRTFAWNGQYDTAKVFLRQVIDRSPYYEDAFNAYSDISYWEGDTGEAANWAEKGLSYHPKSLDLLARRARGLLSSGKIAEAKKITTSVLEKDPKHELALEIERKLTP